MGGQNIAGGTSKAAQGRWREILLELGLPAQSLTGKHGPCPMCRGKDRFRFDDKEGAGSYICGQCGAGSGFHLLQKFHGWTFRQAADEIDKIIGNLPAPKPVVQRHRMTREDVARMWKTGQQVVTDDRVGTYLRARGVDLAVWPRSLRYTPRMWHAPTRKYVPCMLGNFRSADDETGTVHRTYLETVEPRRMFVPFGVPRGGAIRLGDPDLCMGVAEGIETALSASLLFRLPVWACCNEGLLRQWQPPECATHITIFGDNDSSYVGQRAAYELAWRLAREGKHVSVQIPHEPDWDWNDVVRIEKGPDLSQLRIRGRDGKPTSQSISAGA